VLQDVRAWDAVGVVGAGISVGARLPAAVGRDSLLWQALEVDPVALDSLIATTGAAEESASCWRSGKT
jgi:hypothetical protein